MRVMTAKQHNNIADIRERTFRIYVAKVKADRAATPSAREKHSQVEFIK